MNTCTPQPLLRDARHAALEHSLLTSFVGSFTALSLHRNGIPFVFGGATLSNGIHQILRTAWPSAVDEPQLSKQIKNGNTLMKIKRLLMSSGSALLLACTLSAVSMSQDAPASSQRPDENTFEGTVVSSTRDTLVVRTEDNQFQLFVFDRYTTKPRSISNGSRVRVVSTPGEEGAGRLASNISMLESAPSAQGGHASDQAQPIPPAVRDLEHDIKRQARRWRLGVRAGAGLDPELLMFGVHSQIGPIFHRNVFFRPNAEFDFGEVTDLIALNLEAVYRLPVVQRQAAWAPYLGAGPGFTFLHQSFQNTQGQGRNIDFGNFDFNTGFNILAGVQFRRGTFFEIKTSIYSRPAPTVRLIFGYNF